MSLATLSKNIFKILLIIVILGIICFLFYLPYLRVTPNKEFEGIVLDKWVNVRETEQGSRPSRHILVKSDIGEQFDIIVDTDTYDQLQSGTRIKRNSNGELQISK
jgi:hypothetical protein